MATALAVGGFLGRGATSIFKDRADKRNQELLMRQLVLGVPAVVDENTKRVIVPARPGIDERLTKSNDDLAATSAQVKEAGKQIEKNSILIAKVEKELEDHRAQPHPARRART